MVAVAEKLELTASEKDFLSDICEALGQWFFEPPTLRVSEWAAESRQLSQESTSEHGSWNNDKVPYFVEVMNALNDPETEIITCKKSSQVGWTEVLLTILGYYADQDPCPVLFIEPTIEIAEAISKDRLDPMIRDTPALTKIMNTGARNKKNSLRHKMFPGGHWTLGGANSPASLASRPVRVLIADELDRFPVSAGDEGDPLKLGEKRTTTYWNRKKFRGGTPTIKGASRTDEEFEKGTQEYFYIRCANKKCKNLQKLVWSQVKWPKDVNKETGEEIHLWQQSYYECEQCKYQMDDNDITEGCKRGIWIADKPERGNYHRSFFINELYSQWVALAETVRDFLDSKDNMQTLKVWTNTSLGESFEIDVERLDDNFLYARRENYNSQVPEGVLALVAGVDVQDDRLEVEIVGYDEFFTSWSIDYRVFYGNPAESELWKRIDSILTEVFEHESGARLTLDAMAIDSGGHHTTKVYDFVRERLFRQVYAIKGVPGFGKPSVSKPSKRNKGNVNLYSLGVDSIKQQIYAELQILEPTSPGYAHFPISGAYTPDYFKGLTAEEMVTTYRKGIRQIEWNLPGGRRNEPLDCRAYARASLEILNPAWHTYKRRIEIGGVVIQKDADGNEIRPDLEEIIASRKVKSSPGRRVLSRGVTL